MTETYQGCNAQMFPVEYARRLRQWCDDHGAILIFDEIQAAFGRTGKMFGFQHLGIVPDLITCGKGISGGMPLSAVVGRREVMDLYGPGADDQHPHGQPRLLRGDARQPPGHRGRRRRGKCRAAGTDPRRGLCRDARRLEGADRPGGRGRTGRRRSSS